MERVLASADDAVARATATLDKGEPVLLPGDQRYLLGVDALDDEAVEQLFRALARGADDAPTVLVSGYEDLHHVAYASALARQLVDAHWPGPTTLALRARPWLPDVVGGAGEAVRVSAPRSEFANRLARHFGPIATVAAGEATDAEAAHAFVGASARLLVDGGVLPGGRAHVLDARGAEAKVIRDGTSAAR